MPAPREFRPRSHATSATFLSVVAWLATCLTPVLSIGDEVGPYPAGARVKNAKTDFGAVADGVTDDTAALQAAFSSTINNGGRILYLPAGTYRISDTLYWKDTQKTWQSKLTLQGAGRGLTVIKLSDRLPAFGNVKTPKAMIYTASNSPLQPKDGGGYNGFRNYINDLTVDTGTGNPGATGIDFNGTNRAGIYRVTVRSSDPDRVGFAGISMLRYATGPCVLRDVKIEGFDHGFRIAHSEYSQTYVNLSLVNQRVAGIHNTSNITTFVGLSSQQPAGVPAIIAPGVGTLTTILGGNFTGTSGASALVLGGGYYLDSCVATDYEHLLATRPGVATPAETPWFSGDPKHHESPFALFSTARKSLGLAARDTPVDFRDPVPTNYVNVMDFGAIPLPTNAPYNPGSNDSTRAIQAAIDHAAATGKTTVYFPFGFYYVSDTITIHGAIRRLAFLESEVWPKGPKFSDPANPLVMFRFSGTVDCQWDGLDTGSYVDWHRGLVWIEHNSSSALTLKHCQVETRGHHRSYRNTAAGSGDLYLEDVETNQGDFGWDFASRQNVWAISLNEETRKGTHLHVGAGVSVRIVGYKSESAFNQAVVDQDGSLEILGGLVYPLSNPDLSFTAFVNSGRLSFILAFSAYTKLTNDYQNFVSETRNGVTKVLQKSSIIRRGYGSLIPLYVGY